MLLELSKIRTDGGTQARVCVPPEALEEYVQALADRATFPDVVVFHDGTHYWLADGHIRLAAHVRAGLGMVGAEVRQGTLKDAILYAAGANSNHGWRRTNADKQKAVRMLLGDQEWWGRSDRWIAEAAGVSYNLVAKLRKATATNGGSQARLGQDGKERRMPAPEDVDANLARLKRLAEEAGGVTEEHERHARGDLAEWARGQEPDDDLDDVEPGAGLMPPRVALQADREPGDDTEQIEKDKAEEKAKPKNGSPLFDWKKFEGHLGHVVRAPGDLAEAYPGEKHCAELARCEEATRVYCEAMSALKQRLTGSGL